MLRSCVRGHCIHGIVDLIPGTHLITLTSSHRPHCIHGIVDLIPGTHLFTLTSSHRPDQHPRTMDADTPPTTQVVKEGRAEIFSPSHVFYNPVQEFNRDLTIAVISEHISDHFKQLQEKSEKSAADVATESICDPVEAGVKHEHGVKILEALSASGLRSIRFALEVPGIKQIITNDFDENAVSFIRRNVEHNKVESLVTPSHADASMVMYQNRKYVDRFDVIDLDPYGTAAPFLDSAVQAIKDGGLLCITCTDMAVLAGNAPETCYSKYQAVSLRAKFCHEQALRILLQCVESHANRYSRYIVPLISVSADFYIRVFLRVYTGQNIVKHSVCKISMIYNCVNCGNFTLQPLATKIQTSKQGDHKFTPARAPVISPSCTVCGSRQSLGGPIWNAPLHDVEFVKRVILRVKDNGEKFGTGERIRGVLSVISEELQDVPLYYIADELNKTIHCTPMNMMELRSAILNAGYQVSFSHCQKTSIKTTAPIEFMWDIFRCWVKKHPVNKSRLKDGTLAKIILSKESTVEVDFTEHSDANPLSRKMGLLRWQPNPERDWGPKARATRGDKSNLDALRKKGSQKAKEKKRKVNDMEIDYKLFSCKRHKEGLCDMGDECRYSHTMVTDDTCTSEDGLQKPSHLQEAGNMDTDGNSDCSNENIEEKS